jgi:hypothetical protein
MKNEKLQEAVTKLCEDLTVSHNTAHPTLAKYNSFTTEAGRKFIKVINQDTFNGDMSQTVWGFINIAEFSKDRKMANGIKTVTFKEGDVLMANGWRAPALNVARGNLYDGYHVNSRRIAGPDYTSSNRTL